MIKKKRNFAFVIAVTSLSLVSFSVEAVDIDNGLSTDEQGYWRVDVTTGGESRDAYITGTGTPSGTVFEEEEIVFDYFSYIDFGSGGIRLSSTVIDSAATVTNPGEVTSSGHFLTLSENTINWVMVSTIPAGSTTMTSVLTLTAATGTLGAIDFYQYLDEDVLGSGDDFFFTQGSAAGNDLQLFTIDYTEAIGISHSGALSGGQGLVNSNFSGWAADQYDNMRPMISAGTQTVSLGGTIGADLASTAGSHPVVGAGYGPLDIVSVATWSVNPGSTTATVITTLGGVPNIGDVVGGQTGETIPVPALQNRMLALLTLILGFAGIMTLRGRRRIS